MTKGEFQALKGRILGTHKNRYHHKAWRKLTGYKSGNPPEGNRAWSAVSRALKKGTLVKEPCRYCGDTRSQAHHYNGYENPLDVEWVCQSCHHRLHLSSEEGRKILGIGSDVRRVPRMERPCQP